MSSRVREHQSQATVDMSSLISHVHQSEWFNLLIGLFSFTYIEDGSVWVFIEIHFKACSSKKNYLERKKSEHTEKYLSTFSAKRVLKTTEYRAQRRFKASLI